MTYLGRVLPVQVELRVQLPQELLLCPWLTNTEKNRQPAERVYGLASVTARLKDSQDQPFLLFYILLNYTYIQEIAY